MLLKIFNSKFLPEQGFYREDLGLLCGTSDARAKAEMGVQPAIDSLSWQEIFIDESCRTIHKVKRSRSCGWTGKGRSLSPTRPNANSIPKASARLFLLSVESAFLTVL